jgi:hypothetical protein
MAAKTIGEALTEIGQELKETILMAPDPTAVDWTNIKKLFAALLQQFGPLLLSLLVGWLTPSPTE